MLSRFTNRRGLNLTASQHTEMPEHLRHEYIIIPSNTQPAWGGYFTIDIREHGSNLHNIILQINASALTYSTTTSNPRYTPAAFWISRVEFVQSNNIIDTRYANEQFINTQLFNFDEQRKLLNLAMGPYDVTATRQTLSSATNNYYIDLSSFFEQGHVPLLDNKTDLQIRVYMDALANNVVANGSTGSPISTLNSCNAICKLTRMHSSHALSLKSAIASRPHHYKFTELRYGTFNVSSGVSATSLILTQITGKVHYLFFTVRPTNALVGDNEFSYTAINNYALLDNSGANIVGGQPVPSALSLLILNKDNTKSSYTAESTNNANVYMWSFSASSVDARETAADLTTRQFTGNEQLQITFIGSLAASVQVDVYAYVESCVEYNAAGVRKITL